MIIATVWLLLCSYSYIMDASISPDEISEMVGPCYFYSLGNRPLVSLLEEKILPKQKQILSLETWMCCMWILRLLKYWEGSKNIFQLLWGNAILFS